MIKNIVYELVSPYTLVKSELELNIDRFKSDDILAETKYSAISTGTEIAAWEGKPPLRPSKIYPRLMGYCNLAKVIKVGSSISDISVGNYILTHQSHRTAFICKHSDILLCVDEQDETLLKKLTTTYLYHLGYAALLAGNYKPGHYVAIVGLGTLGITTATLVKLFGIQPFIFSNQVIDSTWIDIIGLKYLFKKQPLNINAWHQLCGMDGVDIVINTSNKWSDYLLSLQLARKGGEVICLGFPGRGEPAAEFNPLDSQYFYEKQLAIKHCGYVTDHNIDPIDKRFTLKRNIQYLSQLIMNNMIDPLQIITREVSWTELDKLYSSLSSRQNGMYSSLLNWNLK